MAVEEAQVQGEFYLEQRRYSQFMHLTYLVIYGHETGCTCLGERKLQIGRILLVQTTSI